MLQIQKPVERKVIITSPVASVPTLHYFGPDRRLMNASVALETPQAVTTLVTDRSDKRAVSERSNAPKVHAVYIDHEGCEGSVAKYHYDITTPPHYIM